MPELRLLTCLDRHIIRETTVPAALAFLVYTLLLAMNGIFSLIEQVVVHGAPLSEAFRLMLYGLPNLIIITLPVSFLFGVLLAGGRMNSDFEIIALQAGGISPWRLLRPLILMGLFLSIGSAWLALSYIPKANENLATLKRDLFRSGFALGRIQPKVFYDEIPNTLLWIGNIDPETHVWSDVFIHRSVSPDVEELTLAERGRIVLQSGSTPEPWIQLEGMTTYTTRKDSPEKLLKSTVQTNLFRPGMEEESNRKQKLSYGKSLSEMTSPELFKLLYRDHGDEAKGINLRAAAVEMHHRLSIPFACLAFAMLGLPLGIGSRSGGRGRGFLFSILVVLAYFILDSFGSYLVREGSVSPWIGMWLPDFLIIATGLLLARKMGHWMGERQTPDHLIVRIYQAYQRWRLKRQQVPLDESGRPITGSLPISIQRKRYVNAFPSLLDRYLTRRFTTPLFLVLASTTVMYIIGDLTNHFAAIAKNHAPLGIVLSYYWNTIPRAVIEVLPFGMLIAVLTVLTVLQRHQELTAFKAAGLSVYRILIPLFLCGLLGVGAMWVLGENIVPRTNRISWKLLDDIKGKTNRNMGFAIGKNWILSRDSQAFYTFLRYDAPSESLIRFAAYRVDEENRLRYILMAPRLLYVDGAWIADGGWLRTIDVKGVDHFIRITKPVEVAIPEGPSYFSREYRQPSEMSQSQLREYIARLEESGYHPSALIVRWYQKFTTPLSVLILMALGIPFALKQGTSRVSTMQGIGIALGLGLAYFTLLVPLFAKLGEAEFLPPILGAWGPVLIGILVAINRLSTLRT